MPANDAKGLFGGKCNRTACKNSPATWWNPHTHAFYCRKCAQAINIELQSHNLELIQDKTLGTPIENKA